LSITYQEVSRAFAALETLDEIKVRYKGSDGVVSILEKRLSPARVEILHKNAEPFKRLLYLYSGDHPLVLSIKAEKISYLHENVYQDGEIITDARPVFNSDGT
jgi:hypothetical protein